MTVEGQKSYRRILKEAYLERRAKNGTYSLRAFARQIGLSPAFVSLIFQEKRHLSHKLAVKIAKKFNWNDQEQKYFLSLLEFENPKTEMGREAAVEQIRQFETSTTKPQPLDADVFAAISVWYYNAILTLLTLKNTKHTVHTISQRLKLDKHETEAALQRLKRLGLAQSTGNVWSATHNRLRVESIPSNAVRTYHKEILKLAADALERQSYNEREFSNLTITTDPKNLALAKAKILKFRAEMAQLLDGSNATEVFQLSIQLFRLTQPKK